jgi:hypothetical protein
MSELLLGTRNYAYDSDTTMTTPGTSVSTNTPDKAADRLKSTGWETTHATPQLDTELTADRAIDSLFFRHSNVATYRIQSSPDGAVWSDIATGLSPQNAAWGHRFEFMTDTKDYWRLQVDSQTVPGDNTFIYEIFWFQMRVKLDYDDAVSGLAELRKDSGGGEMVTTTGRFITFSGIGGSDSIKEHLGLDTSLMSKANYNSFYSLWSTPLVRGPFVISPYSDDRERTFEAGFKGVDFLLSTDGKQPRKHFSGVIEIQER